VSLLDSGAEVYAISRQRSHSVMDTRLVLTRLVLTRLVLSVVPNQNCSPIYPSESIIGLRHFAQNASLLLNTAVAHGAIAHRTRDRYHRQPSHQTLVSHPRWL